MKAAKKKSRIIRLTAAAAPRVQARTPIRRADPDTIDVAAMVESIIGCKWSVHVLAEVRRGVNRPGALVRSAPGLTTKVLSERLDKMIRFGIFEKTSYAEVPPRVEYRFTPFGEKFMRIIDAVDALERELGAESSTEVAGR